ncbi:MAG: phosphatidate cytidylyltransferase [Bacteroidales bacterium]|nr:phosphatidate cytidylyltransferase [Bacteroidales bacterium]
MNNLVKRALSGAVFVAVIIGSIMWHPYAYAGVFGVIVAWSLLEFYGIIAGDQTRADIVSGVLTGVFLFAGSFFYVQKAVDAGIFLLLVPLYVAFLICRIYRRGNFSFRGAAYIIMGVVYVALPFALCNRLVFPPPGQQYAPGILAGFFILLWTNDTFAYLTGIVLGKHRLFERISPKKSWEGFFGGLLFTVAGSFFVQRLFPLSAGVHWTAIALVIVVFGVYGDLLESLLKRNMNMKDSGRFLPGHGGILDRFDAVLLAAPMVYTYLALFVF